MNRQGRSRRACHPLGWMQSGRPLKATGPPRLGALHSRRRQSSESHVGDRTRAAGLHQLPPRPGLHRDRAAAPRALGRSACASATANARDPPMQPRQPHPAARLRRPWRIREPTRLPAVPRPALGRVVMLCGRPGEAWVTPRPTPTGTGFRAGWDLARHRPAPRPTTDGFAGNLGAQDPAPGYSWRPPSPRSRPRNLATRDSNSTGSMK